MEIQGKIVHVLELQQGIGQASGKEWKRQEYVLETLDERYPKKVAFNLWGDAIDRFMLREGDEVTVSFDLESREWNGRWYTEVRAYNIQRGVLNNMSQFPSNASIPQMPINNSWPTQEKTANTSSNDEFDGGELPF